MRQGRSQERRIYSAFFQGPDRIGHRKVLDPHIVFCQPGSFQDLPGIQRGPGTGCPHRNCLSFQILEFADPGQVVGDDLDGFWIEHPHLLEIFQGTAFIKIRPGLGIPGHIALDQGQISLFLAQEFDIGQRAGTFQSFQERGLAILVHQCRQIIPQVPITVHTLPGSQGQFFRRGFASRYLACFSSTSCGQEKKQGQNRKDEFFHTVPSLFSLLLLSLEISQGLGQAGFQV